MSVQFYVMGIIWEAQVFHLFAFMHSFQNLVILNPYVIEKTAIEIALNANECV